MSRLLDDYKLVPRQFFWVGPIDPSRLREMLQTRRWVVPDDLFLLWVDTGGGEIFESETLLAPFGDPALGENLFATNDELRKRGLSDNYVVFHQGIGISAIRQSDRTVVRVDEENFSELHEYASVDDWYLSSIRPVYADVVGLSS